MIRSPFAVALILLAADGWGFSAGAASPSDVFDLTGWKLQIPGPREIQKLAGYSSSYFQLNREKEMCFNLDASEKGSTPNTKYVRAELRHEPEWKVGGHHTLSASVRVVSKLQPDKVTVLQIHGIAGDGGNAPPLLRIAVQAGDLYAVVKRSADGRETDAVPLKRGIGSGFFKVTVTVREGVLVVLVDGKEHLRRDVTFWKFDNYFKAGCYPQALQGSVQVVFRELSVG